MMMAPPPRRLRTRRRLATTHTTTTLLAVWVLLSILQGTTAFFLPAPPAASRPAPRSAAAAAAAPRAATSYGRLVWGPPPLLRASADDEQEEDDAGIENDRDRDEAAIAAATPPPTATAASTSTNTNLSGTIPDLLGLRSLGLDWGHKKIGVGVSAGFSQRPLGTIPNVGGTSGNATLHRPTLDHILALVRAEAAVQVVIGNPLYRDGTLSPQANSTKTFARMLANRAVEVGMAEPWRDGDGDRPPRTPFVFLWDERLTSQAARVNIKTKAFLHSMSDVDSQAACLILEDFYQARAYKAEIVWPDPGVEPLRASPPKGSSNSEGRAEDGAAAAGGTAVGAGGAGAGGAARTHMSYDDWRRAERERYEASRVNFQQAAEEGAAKRKKKKKKKK